MSLRRRAPKAVAALAALIALPLVLSGCAGAAASPTPPPSAAGGIYRLPISDPASQIDPLTASDQNALAITGLVTEPLVSLDADGSLRPRLATEWSASEDGLTWTVGLRSGAEFNDGTPVTAADVVATFEAIVAEGSLSPGRAAFLGILESVTAVDAGTVVFSLQRPFSDFPLLLTGMNTGILPADYDQGSWL